MAGAGYHHPTSMPSNPTVGVPSLGHVQPDTGAGNLLPSNPLATAGSGTLGNSAPVITTASHAGSDVVIPHQSSTPWMSVPPSVPASAGAPTIGPVQFSPTSRSSSSTGLRRQREEDHVQSGHRRRTDDPDTEMTQTGTRRKREDYDGDDVQYTPSQPPGPPPPPASGAARLTTSRATRIPEQPNHDRELPIPPMIIPASMNSPARSDFASARSEHSDADDPAPSPSMIRFWYLTSARFKSALPNLQLGIPKGFSSLQDIQVNSK